MLAQIRAITAADPTNILVVFPHWGYELSHCPEPADREWARAAIDAGADAVIGHHPHVVQGAEQYGDGFIFYSIGNWILPEAKYLDKNLRYRSDDFALQLAVELMWGDKVSVALHWFRYDRKSGVISYEGTDSGLDGLRIGALSGFAGLPADKYRNYFRGQIAAGKATPRGYPTFGSYSGLLGMSYPFKLGYIRLRKLVA